MKNWISLSTLALAGWAAASASFAGAVTPVGAPAPLLGAGLPGLAILAVTGAGYLAIRLRRRDRD
ncbi:hypothetical protein [Phenylobacterium sp.]|uniref:hypothetical protein n=1 Tax=Phenylobacterium sp. TaxID=1871053 RepID=UPI003565CA35